MPYIAEYMTVSGFVPSVTNYPSFLLRLEVVMQRFDRRSLKIVSPLNHTESVSGDILFHKNPLKLTGVKIVG